MAVRPILKSHLFLVEEAVELAIAESIAEEREGRSSGGGGGVKDHGSIGSSLFNFAYDPTMIQDDHSQVITKPFIHSFHYLNLFGVDFRKYG